MDAKIKEALVKFIKAQAYSKGSHVSDIGLDQECDWLVLQDMIDYLPKFIENNFNISRK